MWLEITTLVSLLSVGFTVASHLPEWNFLSVDKVPVVSQPLERPVVVNFTDLVYRSALRFRHCMRDPDNPYNMALLDPLAFSISPLADRSNLRLDGTMTGSITQLSQYDINSLTVAVPSTSARIWGVLPHLGISGSYNTSGTLAQTLPIFGSGSFSVDMKNVSLEVTILLTLDSSGSLRMSDFTVKFTPASTQVTLGEFMGGGPLGDLLQEFVQDSALQFLDRAGAMITADIRNTVSAATDSKLSTKTDLADFLVVFGNKTDTC